MDPRELLDHLHKILKELDSQSGFILESYKQERQAAEAEFEAAFKSLEAEKIPPQEKIRRQKELAWDKQLRMAQILKEYHGRRQTALRNIHQEVDRVISERNAEGWAEKISDNEIKNLVEGVTEKYAKPDADIEKELDERERQWREGDEGLSKK